MVASPPRPNERFQRPAGFSLHARTLISIVALAAYGIHAANGAEIPVPGESPKAAQEIIAEIRQVEPQLPDVETAPIAFGTGMMDVTRVIEIAIANNLTMQDARDQVELAALSYLARRNGYFPQWQAQILAGYQANQRLIDSINDTGEIYTTSQTIGVSQKLPFGGSASLDLGASAIGYENNNSLGPSPKAVFSISQPLLRGFGADLQREPLVVARQNVAQTLRRYSDTLDNFALSVLEDFIALQNMKQKLANLEAKQRDYDQLVNQTTAFHKLGRRSNLELLRVTQEALSVRQAVQDMAVDLADRTARLQVTLNVPLGTPLDFEPFVIPFEKIQITPKQAIETALKNRADLRTATESVEESRRATKFAKRDLLPRLDLNVSAGSSQTQGGQREYPINNELRAGVRLTVELDQSEERLGLFRSSMFLEQDERFLERLKANLAAGVTNAIARLKNVEVAIETQNLLIEAGTKRAKIAKFLYEQGQTSNREVIDANSILIAAQNSRIDLLASHRLGVLRLKKQLGTLNIREKDFMKSLEL